MKRLCALLAALLLAAACLCCAQAQSAPVWLDSSVIGAVTEATPTNPKDDFYLHVNKDWILNKEMSASDTDVTAFSEREDELNAQMTALLGGEMARSHEGRLAQTMYQMYTDMDTRNALGVAPLMPYVKRIEAIDSIEALSAYLLETDTLDGGLCSASTMADLMDSSVKAVYIDAAPFLLGDTDEYEAPTSVGERTKEAYIHLISGMLARCGYTQEDADALIDSLFALETQLAAAAFGSSDTKQDDFIFKIYNPMTLDELKALSPAFPIEAFLKKYTDLGAERFILMDKDWFAKFNELYTQENLEGFKAKLIATTLTVGSLFTDAQAIALNDESSSMLAGIPYTTDIEEEAYITCNLIMDMATGRLYAETYVSDQTRREVTQMVMDMIAVYKARLKGAAWLGEDTRAKALEKLDALSIRVSAPDDWERYDYADLTLKSYAEGGDLISNYLAVDAFYRNKHLREFFEPVDKTLWSTPPQIVNATYNRMENAVYIPAGILGGVFYDAQASYEENLAAIGMIIGHEITHAFDNGGSQYDADGNLNNWWTDEDKAKFSERTQAVREYFDAIEVLPGKYCDGQLTLGENIADLGGMSCVLEVAKAHEDFDYQAFFTAYAQMWRNKLPLETEEIKLQNVHAVKHLRVNAIVQQFEEFHKAFDIQPGDGMYLAPEYRLSVW